MPSNPTYLFSYGTLQNENVQITSFGRILKGEKDSLSGYKIDFIEITDPEVISKSGKTRHPIIIKTNNNNDIVEGTAFEVTDKEVSHADLYEVNDYKRESVKLNSNKTAWAYIKA